MVTAGANQAFTNLVLALLDEDDAAVLFKPYYFNHLMAVQVSTSRHCDQRTVDSLSGDLVLTGRCKSGSTDSRSMALQHSPPNLLVWQVERPFDLPSMTREDAEVAAACMLIDTSDLVLQMSGGAEKVVFGRCDPASWHPDLDWLEAALAGPSPPRMVVLVNPCNPTGLPLFVIQWLAIRLYGDAADHEDQSRCRASSSSVTAAPHSPSTNATMLGIHTSGHTDAGEVVPECAWPLTMAVGVIC